MNVGRTMCVGLIALGAGWLVPRPAVADTDPAKASADAGSPAALVKDLYARHAKDEDPFAKPEDRALVERFFDKPLADAIGKDATVPEGELGALDADPLYDAQDTDIKKLTVGTPVITGETAKVVVTFENIGEKRAVTYLLVKRPVGWRISDIEYADHRRLLGIYKKASR
jgi:hypothetical protein